MKRLILATAIFTGTVSSYAITNNETPLTNTAYCFKNDTFKEISLDKLPSALNKALKKDFTTAKVNKAYVNQYSQYKLELSINKETKIVYADKDGNWLDEKEISNLKK